MFVWDSYPENYRAREIKDIFTAVHAGECVAVVGLSGAGKSNLIGFLANRSPLAAPRSALIDCNRLPDPSAEALYALARRSLGNAQTAADGFLALESAIEERMARQPEGLCLFFDRFDFLSPANETLFGNLRALRDAFKYKLTYVISTRRLLDPHNELAELFFANTLWLGPLSESDARWNVARYAQRKGITWDETTVNEILRFSGGYPSLLRAVCEACSDGTPLEMRTLSGHPAIQRRVGEFWADQPGDDDLRRSGLEGQLLLCAGRPSLADQQLTAKEHLLLEYLRQHPNQVCDKDDLIHAVWPEDRIFERGIRDDSLAQIIRRLREKIEPDPSNPSHIHTVPGRGYRYVP
jgi:energy-coupling factor transporter ATP-binding protein EcfA2